jgi:hypothetical protein
MLCKVTLHFALLAFHKLSEHTTISIPKKVFDVCVGFIGANESQTLRLQ